MIVAALLLALTLSAATTYGFPVYAYGRWQRVVGFASYARCMEIREAIRDSQPSWRVGETCVADVSRRVPLEKP